MQKDWSSAIKYIALLHFFYKVSIARLRDLYADAHAQLKIQFPGGPQCLCRKGA